MVDAELEQLSKQVSVALLKASATLATAESCTGGWVAEAVTAVAGCSDWFDRGFITYSNAAKRDMVGVSLVTLKEYGAVSEETAREMALGALKHSKAHIALSITGIAGPTGGSPGKPVGTVCFGWARGTSALRSEIHLLKGDRASVRRQSVIISLRGVLRLLAEPEIMLA
ncbi:MAG: nicotinamide-nucleotide amidohydrolase family protein [Burkholderiales bacterium]